MVQRFLDSLDQANQKQVFVLPVQVFLDEGSRHISHEACIESKARDVTTVFDGHEQAETPCHSILIKRQIPHVKDPMRQKLQILEVSASLDRLCVESLLVEHIVELDVDFVVDGVYIGSHALVDLVYNAIRRCYENSVDFSSNLDPRHEYLIQLALSSFNCVFALVSSPSTGHGVVLHRWYGQRVELHAQESKLTIILKLVGQVIIEELKLVLKVAAYLKIV